MLWSDILLFFKKYIYTMLYMIINIFLHIMHIPVRDTSEAKCQNPGLHCFWNLLSLLNVVCCVALNGLPIPSIFE